LMQARASRQHMEDIRPVLQRSQKTIEAFLKSGGHRHRSHVAAKQRQPS
jgi:hypothetical protein